MGKPRAFTDEQEAEIARQYEQGKSSPQLAKEWDSNYSTIIRALQRQGVDRRSPGPRPGTPLRRFSPSEVAEITERYRKGETQESLAAAFGCAASTISRLLHREGLDDLVAERLRKSNWKGGRRVDEKGYVHVMPEPGDPYRALMGNKDGYVREHRLVMARHLGRPLARNERVHHKNGDRTDNRLENLELWVGGHPPGQRDPHCPTCTCFAD